MENTEKAWLKVLMLSKCFLSSTMQWVWRGGRGNHGKTSITMTASS